MADATAPSWLRRIVDAVVSEGAHVAELPAELARAQPLLDAIGEAVSLRCQALADVRREAFEDGRRIERVRSRELLRLVDAAVAARRTRMTLEGEHFTPDVTACATAECAEVDAVCALLDYAESLPRY